jgi:hypothetical protein
MQVEKEIQPQRSEQSEEKTKIEPRNMQKEQPRRDRRKPAYLKDYVSRWTWIELELIVWT